MKKVLFKCNGYYFTHVTVFYWKNKYAKVLNGDVHGTSMGPSCETFQGPKDGMFWGCPGGCPGDVPVTSVIHVF